MHYARLRSNDSTRPRCSIESCDNIVSAQTFCSKHYTRLRRHGDPLAGRTFDGEPMAFLESILDAEWSEDCIIWPFVRDRNGYGKLRYEDRCRSANQVILEKTVGPAPPDKPMALHACSKGHLGCCHPKHLIWGNQPQNMEHMVEAGTSCRGERQNHAKLTVRDVNRIRLLGNQGDILQRELAEMFGVSQGAISGIVNRTRWAWL